MSTETAIEENQHFSVAMSNEQGKILQAKEILAICRPFVYKATVERDFSAYPVLAKLDEFVKGA